MMTITGSLQVIMVITIPIAILKNDDDIYMNIRYSADCTQILTELDNYLETPICSNNRESSSAESTPPPFETSDEGDNNFLVLADIIASTPVSENCDTEHNIVSPNDKTESSVYLQNKFPTLSNLDEIECCDNSNVDSSQGNWVGTNDTPSDEQPPVNPEKEDSDGSSDKTGEESPVYQSQRLLIYHPESTEDDDEPCRLKRTAGFYAKTRTAYRGRLSGYGLQRWKLNESVRHMSGESTTNF
uniref:Protein E31B n=1 Tax=Elephant endotheliotropic herpesvirus 1A TaxID=759753 RepID=A0A866VUE1_ELHV1|nr:protein E31B [Elephant endotheliotropic herpesvirus 1A]